MERSAIVFLISSFAFSERVISRRPNAFEFFTIIGGWHRFDSDASCGH